MVDTVQDFRKDTNTTVHRNAVWAELAQVFNSAFPSRPPSSIGSLKTLWKRLKVECRVALQKRQEQQAAGLPVSALTQVNWSIYYASVIQLYALELLADVPCASRVNAVWLCVALVRCRKTSLPWCQTWSPVWRRWMETAAMPQLGAAHLEQVINSHVISTTGWSTTTLPSCQLCNYTWKEINWVILSLVGMGLSGSNGSEHEDADHSQNDVRLKSASKWLLKCLLS